MQQRVQGRHLPRVRTTHFPGVPRAASLVAREQRDLHRERGQLGLGQRRVPPVAEGTAPHKHRLGSTSVATHAPHTSSRWQAPKAVSTVEGKWSVRQFPPPSKPASQPVSTVWGLVAHTSSARIPRGHGREVGASGCRCSRAAPSRRHCRRQHRPHSWWPVEP
eukprot:COSAG01_NODE_4091_length_5357_cov_9.914036_3_plen_163_part_00